MPERSPEKPYPFERRLGEFDRTVAGAQRELVLAINLGLRSDLATRRAQFLQLARITAVLDQLGAYVDPAARKLVADAYSQGADRTGQRIASLAVDTTTAPIGGVAAEAVAVLQESAEEALREGRVRIGRQIQDVYARAGRQAATRAILGAEGSPRTAQRRVVADLLRDRQIAGMAGGPGFVDAAGRKWGIDRYAMMVVRTTTREAVVQGAMDRMASHGIDLARVLVSPSACQVCQPYSGRLIDLAGNGRDYQGEPVMTGPPPPYHPNCTCALSPVAVRIEALQRELAGT